MAPIIYAILAAASFGLWTIFHKLASPHVNQIFGAVIVSLTAVIFGAAVFFLKARDEQLFSDPKGLFFMILAGIAAFFIDYLALLAYSRGLSLSVGGPVIIGGSMVVAVSVGILMGESINFAKFSGIFLIVLGGIILGGVNK